MKYVLNRNIQFFFLINILKITLGIEFDNNKKALLILKASRLGYNLQNNNDVFYYDLCLPYSYNKKDVTLEYRRNYFFFPDKNKNKNAFYYPKRNDTIKCFTEYFDVKNIFTSASFYILISLVFYQSTFLISYILFKNQSTFLNNPLKKMEDKNKYLCYFGNKKRNKEKNNSREVRNFSEFVPEMTIQQNLEIDDNIQNESNKNFETNINNIEYNNTNSNMIIKDISSEILMKKDKKENEDKEEDTNNSQKIHYSIENTTDVMKNNIQNSVNTASFENSGNIDDKIDEKMSQIKGSEILSEVEKSIDNYTFGKELRFGNKFNNIDKDEKLSSKRKESKNDKLKNQEYIFETMNNNGKIKHFKINNDISGNNKRNNTQSYATGNNSTKARYVREEYFYFGYLLARIEDKRSVVDIYFDLLEQCQIIFKFCFCPFNIYEDRKIQVIYYLLKINLYLIFNCILIDSSVINNIFDEKNTLADDILRSCISSICTYFIGLFLYSLTNLKKELIRRRYKLLNMRINQRDLQEIIKMTQRLYLNNFYNKLILLYILTIVIFFISLFICFSFCKVYRNTQVYILKGVLLSIYISQISPFFLCWIPAISRRISMIKKNIILYKITRYIEILFVA